MARDFRANGRIYIYLYVGKHPDTQTTVRQYVGTGAVAASIAVQDAEQRASRRSQRNAEKGDRQRLVAATQLTRKAVKAAKRAMAIELAQLGYHQHSRGIWRKRWVEWAAANHDRQGCTAASGPHDQS